MAKRQKPSLPDTKDLQEYTSALRSLTDLLRKLLADKVAPQVESWATDRADKAKTPADRNVALDALKTWQTAVADLDELLRHVPHYLIVMMELARCEKDPAMPEMPEPLQALVKLYRRLYVSQIVAKTEEGAKKR